ncbi:MAG TPA: dTMP kinase [Mycobacteriales bacterium]|nr:dTMP kinase [Mycobacteriales bacterium]
MLRIADFRWLWIALALSSLGDWLGLLATTALATELATGYQAQNFALGGVLVVRLLPSVILGPFAGVFADRFDRRYTMVVSDVARFGLFASIPLVGSLVWLFGAQFLIECLALFWIPAKEASVPNLVRRNQIEAANQLSLVTTYGITPVAAAAVFAVLAYVARVLSPHSFFLTANRADLALYMNAATFAIAALTVLRIKRISGSHERMTGAAAPGLMSLLREGVVFVGSTPLVRGLIIGILGAFAAGGTVIGTGKIYARSLGGGDAAYGLLFGAVFVGLGLGMALGPRVVRDFSRRRLFGLSIVFAGGCLVLVAVMPHLALSVITVAGVGFGAGVAYLAGMTLLGAEVEDEVRGRVFAFVQSMVRIDLILTLAAVPFLVGLVRQQRVHFAGVNFVVDGTRILLSVGGLLAILVGLLAYRQMDDRREVPLIADLVSSLRGDTTAQRRLGRGGVFIVFEGGEGVGKTTQVGRLADSLRQRDIRVTVTREPGATEVGARVRRILLDPDGMALTPRAEALLFAADRAHHVDTVIRPALEAGEVVLSDRYVDSSLAYQGAGRALPVDEVRRLSRWATGGLEADLTVLLDVAPEVGLVRVRGRSVTDRLESESLEFHGRVRTAFRMLAEANPDRYVVVDASGDPDRIAEVVREAVENVLMASPFGPARRLNGRSARARSVAPPTA